MPWWPTSWARSPSCTTNGHPGLAALVSHGTVGSAVAVLLSAGSGDPVAEAGADGAGDPESGGVESGGVESGGVESGLDAEGLGVADGTGPGDTAGLAAGVAGTGAGTGTTCRAGGGGV